MIESLTGVTATAVGVALDALAQRQQLIATNLANVHSAGYAVRDLSFEGALREVLADKQRSPAESMQALARLKQQISEGSLVRQGAFAAVQMDAEMLRLNVTVIRYQALIEGLSKYGSLARMAISGEVKS